MGNLSQKEMDEIESRLIAFDSTIHKNIKQEYYSLKEMLSSPKQKSDLSMSASIKKILVNPINLSKRLERMGKWIKMVFPAQKPYTPSKESSVSDSSSSSDYRSNSSNANSSSLFKKKNVVLKIASPHRHKNVSVDLSGFNSNQTQVSVIEANLRSYYANNKEHFKERTVKGPPDSFRWLSWLIISNVPMKRSYKVYLKYLLDDIDDTVDMQICKDLNRTASVFNTSEVSLVIGSGKYEDMLYRILRAFSNADKKLGYCQGLNFITGFLLSVSNDNEIDTFYMLVALLNNGWNIRGLFLEEFPLLTYYLEVFDAILEKECCDLRKHLVKLEMPNEVWISKWIQTLYTMSLPYDINLRLWDCMLSHGIEFIISFSVTLIMSLEKDLKAFDDAYDLLEYFKSFFASTLNCNSSSSDKEDTEVNLVLRDSIKSDQPNGPNSPQSRNSGVKVIFTKDSCLKEKKLVQLSKILKQACKLHKSYLSKDLFTSIKKTFISKADGNLIAFKHNAIELNPLNEAFLIANTLNSSTTNRTNFKSDISEEENVPFCYRDDISNECLLNKVTNDTPISKHSTEYFIHSLKPKG